MKVLHVVPLILCDVFVTVLAQCPTRDESAAQAEDQTRSCRKSCEDDLNACTGSRKTCNCDDLCGMSCFDPNGLCPDISLLNGGITYSNGNSYNSEATHRCDQGYYFTGQKTRKCRSNKEWSHSGNIPNCARGCLIPHISLGHSYITRGKLSGQVGYPVGHVVTYKCRTGYGGTGSPDRICGSDSFWTSLELICSPKNCGSPPTVNHGSYDINKQTFGGTVTYNCDTGYDLQGTSRFRCLSDGIWTPENSWPTCEAASVTVLAQCPTRDESAAQAEDQMRSCRKSCEDDPNACTGSRKTCNCDDLCGMSCFNPNGLCPDISLHNGEITYSNGNSYNSEATHQCDQGYYFTGQKTRKCRSNKEWSHWNNIPNCERGCSVPKNSLGDSYITSGKLSGQVGYPVGHVVTYRCRTGYDSAGDPDRTCGSDFLWTSLELICSPKNCGSPPTVNHGSYDINKHTVGGTVTYNCNTGYVLRGTSRFRCLAAGIWIPENSWPTCEASVRSSTTASTTMWPAKITSTVSPVTTKKPDPCRGHRKLFKFWKCWVQ